MPSASSSALSSARRFSERRRSSSTKPAGPGRRWGCGSLGGILAWCGAVCYAELATAYPRDGGDYEYLNRAFGPWCGFLFAWAQITTVISGNIAIMAYVFADYAARTWPDVEGTHAVADIGPDRRPLGAQCRRRRRGQGHAKRSHGSESLGIGRDCCGRIDLGGQREAASGGCGSAARVSRRASGSRLCSCCTPTAAGATPRTWRPKSATNAAICRAHSCSASPASRSFIWP